MKKPRSITLVLAFVLSLTSCQDVDSLVGSISKSNSVECEFVSYGGYKSGVYKKFKRLERVATEQELVKLLDHDSGVVVVYSAYALLDLDLIEPSFLIQKFVESKVQVRTYCGCIMDSEYLSSLIYSHYWLEQLSEEDEDDSYKVSLNDTKQLQEIDSIILYTRYANPILLSYVLDNRVYSENYTSIIEEWAIVRRNKYALRYVFDHLLETNRERLILALEGIFEETGTISPQGNEAVEMLELLGRTFEPEPTDTSIYEEPVDDRLNAHEILIETGVK